MGWREQKIKILLHKVYCNLTLLILIVQAGMTQSTTGHWVLVTAEIREGRKSPFLWDRALLIKQWLSGEFLVHEPWQLNFNWISILDFQGEISFCTTQWSGGSPHFPDLPRQGGKASSSALQPMGQFCGGQVWSVLRQLNKIISKAFYKFCCLTDVDCQRLNSKEFPWE